MLENYSQTVPNGQVISQAPAAGASVAPGTQVTIFVSKGPQPTDAQTVQVPNVVQQEQAKAEQTLKDVGLVPNVLTSSRARSTRRAWSSRRCRWPARRWRWVPTSPSSSPSGPAK